ncbi:unnamed protein product [Hydatigera taeniaeformis]|uniref:TLE_N domain-containing protein n=1 Tax=Hydatigena taeniaeformis TaxID=6205 RepID=A0A0R3WLS0_HYDTA|nr:unnamed protein product [Hydatigera taeniaeformis]
MYPSRPPVPSGPGQSYKFTVVETCERIKDEFNFVQQQCHQLQTEREKLLSERVDMQRICVVYYEMANGLNLEMHRQMEISKRLNAILNQVIPFLAAEHQSQVASAIERAKQVTMQELNSVLTAQMEDSKLANVSTFYPLFLKQIQAHQMSSAGSPSSSLPGSSSANQTGPHGSNVGSAPATGAAFPGSTPGLLPSSAPGLQNAFINGLMSAAGGAMMPPPGTAGLPLSSGAVRDIKDYSSEDKQRVAAAAAAAASQLFRGGAVGQPNLPGSPFLPGGPAAMAAAASFPEGFFGAAAAAAGGVATTSPGVANLNAPGRTSSAGGGVRSNSGHSGISGVAGPVSSSASSLLPPPPPPTPGNSSTAPTPPDEKRRKMVDPKLECPSRENGGCRSADDMDKSSTSSAMSMNASRSGRQPLSTFYSEVFGL